MAEISIRSTLPERPDGGEPVALSEYDAEHPGDGWIFVAGKRVVRVAETPGVMGALRDGRVEKVGGKAEKE